MKPYAGLDGTVKPDVYCRRITEDDILMVAQSLYLAGAPQRAIRMATLAGIDDIKLNIERLQESREKRMSDPKVYDVPGLA